MKLKNITLALAVLFAGGTFAQEAAVMDNNSTEARAENISKRLEKELSLNGKQLEKIKAIQSEDLAKKEALKKLRRDEMLAQREALASERKALKEDKAAYDSKRAELEAKRDAYEVEMNTIEQDTRAKMKSILSESQYEEYLILVGKRQAKQSLRGTKAKARPIKESMIKE